MDNNIAIDDLITALREATEVEREKTEVSKKSLEQEVEEASGYTRINGQLVKQSQARIDAESKLNKELESQFGASKLRAERQESAFNDQLKQLNYIIDRNGKLSKTTLELSDYQQKQISTAKKLIQEEERRSKSQANIIPDLKKGLEDIGKASWGFASGLAKGDTSFSSLIPLMDTVATATQSVGKALLGSIPVIGGFAAAVFGAMTEIAAAVSKLAIQLVEKTLKDFQDMANAGALVSGGMTALYDQLKNAGMTTDGFKKIIKESGSTLAAWQGTVGKGAEEFSKAVGELSLGQAGDDLRKLGMTADSMGESAAAFLEQEIRLGRGRSMTAKQLTEGTVQYAKELDLLQKATGLSRQDLQKQRDEMLSDGRYRAAMQGVNEKNEKALTAFIGQFKDPDMKRGLMDLASGNITSEAAGKVTIALGDSAAETIRAFKDANPDDIPKIWNKAGADMKAAAENNIAMMGETYKYLESGKLINGAVMFDMASGKYVSSMEKAIEIQKEQIQNTDDLTKESVKAQKAMELLSKNMLELAEKMLPAASKAVADFTTALNKAIASYLNPSDRPPTTQNTPTVEDSRKNREEAEKSEKNAREKVESTVPGTDANLEARKAAAEAQKKAAAARAAEEHSRRQKQQQKGPADNREPDKKKSAEQLIKFSSGSGDKAHFDMLNPDVRDAFIKMVEEYGKPVNISSSFRYPAEQQALWDRGSSTGDKDIRKTDGLPVVRPGTSRHEKGRALDLNPSDVNALKATASSTGMDMLKTYGFGTIKDDPPHIQMARFGGVFDGPESGYPVMLHGQEAVVPTPAFAEIKEIMNSVTKSSLAGAMPSASAAPNNNDSINMLKSLNGIMSDKFDQMITVMERSTEIQSRLLNNSMV
jgi:hypothetical protein